MDARAETRVLGNPPRGPIPPHAVIDDFLSEAERAALLRWTLASEQEFKPAPVFYGQDGRELGVKRDVRVALKHSGIGLCAGMLSERLLARLPEIIASVGYQGPEPRMLEFEMNAYGEGAHFAPHMDIAVGAGRRTMGAGHGQDRAITAVYYLYREPQRFSGGALRLYPFGLTPGEAAQAAEADSVAFMPVQNRLVVFPSWALHCVERVSCRSGEFADYRFAVNCWFCRKIGS